MFRKLICSIGLLLCLLGLCACAPDFADGRIGDIVSMINPTPTPSPTPIPTPTPNPWEGGSFAPDGTVMSHSSITHTGEMVEKEGLLPYALYTPSSAAIEEKVPVIVWLHGGADSTTDLAKVETRGLPHAMASGTFEGFNAYVVCPQHMGPLIKSYWATEHTRGLVMDVIMDAAEGRNFDFDKMIIAGHSIGGMGTVYYAGTIPEFWSAAAPISAVDAHPYQKGFNGLPVRAYLANQDGTGKLAQYYYKYLRYAAEEAFFIYSTHGMSGSVAFQLDENEDGRSDLIEWMLSKNRQDRMIEEPVESETE